MVYHGMACIGSVWMSIQLLIKNTESPRQYWAIQNTESPCQDSAAHPVKSAHTTKKGTLAQRLLSISSECSHDLACAQDLMRAMLALWPTDMHS
eukprot:1159240-Pelagomonas_calceolata.AAC.5